MKILSFILLAFGAWYFADLESESAWLCIMAPIVFSVALVLVVAELIGEFGFDFGDEDGSGDGL